MDKVLKLIIVGIALLCNLQVDAQTYRLYGVRANAGKKRYQDQGRQSVLWL